MYVWLYIVLFAGKSQKYVLDASSVSDCKLNKDNHMQMRA